MTDRREKPPRIVWLRRDLRLSDNPAFAAEETQIAADLYAPASPSRVRTKTWRPANGRTRAAEDVQPIDPRKLRHAARSIGHRRHLAPQLAGAGVKLGWTYPHPIVDHAKARNAALAAYKRIGSEAAGDVTLLQTVTCLNSDTLTYVITGLVPVIHAALVRVLTAHGLPGQARQ